MADRRVTVLNPAGYQEVLQTADRLFVDSASQLAETEFTDNITAIKADFSEQITLGLNPTLAGHAVTLDYLNGIANGLELTAATPIEINNQVISILGATETAVGAMRFATDAEVIADAEVDAAVKPDQLAYVLDDLTISGTSPITVAENPSNTFEIDITYATNTADGSVRFATDAEATAGLAETFAVNPKQIKAAIDAIPYATNTVPGIVRFATSAEAQAGTVDNVSVTPAQIQAKIEEITVTGDLPIVVTRDSDSRGYHFTINEATTSAQGTVRYATDAEAVAGVSTDSAVTPKQLETRFSEIVINDATKTLKGIVMLAQHSEVAAGVEDTKAVTAAGIRYALDQPDYLLDGGTY